MKDKTCWNFKITFENNGQTNTKVVAYGGLVHYEKWSPREIDCILEKSVLHPIDTN